MEDGRSKRKGHFARPTVLSAIDGSRDSFVSAQPDPGVLVSAVGAIDRSPILSNLDTFSFHCPSYKYSAAKYPDTAKQYRFKDGSNDRPADLEVL